MTQPYAYVDSPYRCVYDGKRLVAEYGQHEDSGELVETHSCLECGRVWNTCDKALLLPEVHDPGPWMTVEQIAERRASAVDRPEFLRNQPGLRAIVEEWERADREGRNYNLIRPVLERGGFTSAEIRLAESIVAERCGRGEHRTETDSETGDEVCRWCGTGGGTVTTDHVIETYEDLDEDRVHWLCDCGVAGSVHPGFGDPLIAAEKHVDEGESVSYRYPAR